ncbi:hypothetical protein KP79_PYT25265 [Mizuhopecten yessoensis]|uniref:Uncharacterized protein n=1 Tax=Mizuhopecten yessoensis TaxID=6573 RepID=A0A210PNB6_MIZYE|nr:hypothetical protein KP79_PYT25265 [Mizuhopecten yessoensis]
MDTGYDPDILRKIVANVRMLKPDHKCRGFAKVLLVSGGEGQPNTWRCVVQNPPAMQRGHSSTMFRMPLHRLRSLQWDQGKLTFTDIM